MRFSNLYMGCHIALIAASLLGGCGGGSSSPVTDTVSGVSTKTIMGQLAIPQGATSTQTASLLVTGATVTPSACPNLPDGYDPIASATVDVLDAGDNKIGELSTDSCGAFNTTVPEAAASLSVTPSGYKPLKTSVVNFTGNDPKATVSTPPANAQYVITSIQYTGNNTIAFTLTDSITNKAMLGLPMSAVTVQNAQQDLTLKSLGTTLSQPDPASVVLVMDASGSMAAPVVSGGNITDTLTRYDLASTASHLFLSGKRATDETAFIIFDGKVTSIDNAFLGQQNFINASDNQPAAYTISESGFSTDVNKLRPVADLYNPANKIWGSSNIRDRHPDNPYLIGSGYYSWGGSTALWSAASQGIDLLAARTNKRKLLVAMTDGQDNNSGIAPSDLITKAKNAGIPVHMIAFGEAASVNETDMQDVATQTGGEYQRRSDSSITDLFKSIQTGISNQYLLQLSDPVSSGTALTLSIQFDQTSVSRDVTAN